MTKERGERRVPPSRGAGASSPRPAPGAGRSADLPFQPGFFLEREAWTTLEDAVIEPLVVGRVAAEPIRVWVAGAGTGEAAYGIAMILLDRVEATGTSCPIQVFATDASAEALAHARAARYPTDLLRRLGPGQLRFFHDLGENGRRTVTPALRNLVYFGLHSLLDDTPLHDMDIVCCLRDLEGLPAVQRSLALRNLQRAARAGGHLFLGRPAPPADVAPMVTVSRRWGIQRSLGRRAPRSVSIAALFDDAARLVWSRAAGADAGRAPSFGSGMRMIDFGDHFGDALLCADAAVLRSGQVPNDREVQGADGVTYARRLSPHPGGLMVTLHQGSGILATRTLGDITAEFERLASLRARHVTLLNDSLRIANRAESFAQALRDSLESVCVNLEWPLGHVWLGGRSHGGFEDAGVWYRHPRGAFRRFVQATRRFRFAAGVTSLGEVAARGDPLWIPDVTGDPALCRAAEEMIEGGLAGALLVPIRHGQATIGVLEFFTPHGGAPPRAIVDGLAELGAQLGVIREREQSQQALRMLASERLLAEQRERNKLAKDLHDDLGQVLALARMGLDGLRGTMPAQGTAIDRVSTLLAQANETVRSLSFRLSPPVLRELGLVPALEWLAESLPLPPGMRIEVHSRAGDLGWLSEPDRVILFRSARELVINAVKYSVAKVVSVELRRGKSFLVISVTDDGVGFPSPRVATPRGFGLTSVRESLGLLGARLSLAARVGGGARAVIHFPIRKEVFP